MNVLGLFDGISCGQVALTRGGLYYDNYFASEIDQNSIKVAQKNFPNTIQIGDITKIDVSKLPKIDLLIGGSPCQGFSFAGKQLNFEDPRSKLFFEYVRILKELKAINPDIKFLLENVKMKQEHQDIISSFLELKPIFICSSNFSAQKRKRLYWTNIEGISEMKQSDFGNKIQDIMCEGKLDEYLYLNEKDIDRSKRKHAAQTFKTGVKMGSVKFPTPKNEKSKCLTTVRIKGDRAGTHIEDNFGIRLLSITEYEKLQTLPIGYTSLDSIRIAERFKMIGNGWTVDVIVHILNNLKNKK